MKRITNAILTNMCMVCDGQNILVQDTVNSTYTGVTFPGGHIEDGEPLSDAMIREVQEETGLKIRNPVMCGVYDWLYEDGTRYFVFIYKATEFSGELLASEEGNVRWIKKNSFLREKLAHGMDKVFEIIEGRQYTECFYNLKEKEEYMK